MRHRTTVFAIVMAVIGSSALFAQDPVKVDASHYKVLIDNASVRVLDVHYPAGAKSVMHQHPDTVIVPLVASKVRFNTPDGKFTDQEMASESAICAPAGTHSPTNTGTNAVHAIVIEFKGAPGKAMLPAQRTGLTMKTLAECARATATRSTADPAFHEAAGTKHDFDQVVIALSSGQMSLAVAGQPAKTSFARGEVEFIGRGTAHESQNKGGKPFDFIVVSIK